MRNVTHGFPITNISYTVYFICEELKKPGQLKPESFERIDIKLNNSDYD